MTASLWVVIARAPVLADDSTEDNVWRLGDGVLGQIAAKRILEIPWEKFVDLTEEHAFSFTDRDEIRKTLISARPEDSSYEPDEFEIVFTQRSLTRDVFLHAFDHEDDLTLIYPDGRPWLITGGMTTGYPPTDSFDMVWFTDDANLWGEPVTDREIARARADIADATARVA